MNYNDEKYLLKTKDLKELEKFVIKRRLDFTKVKHLFVKTQLYEKAACIQNLERLFIKEGGLGYRFVLIEKSHI